jgi:hypothetical protein
MTGLSGVIRLVSGIWNRKAHCARKRTMNINADEQNGFSEIQDGGGGTQIEIQMHRNRLFRELLCTGKQRWMETTS